MKKWIVLALMLCLFCSAAALAENTVITPNTASKEAETIVRTNVPEMYTVSIPSSLNIEYGRTTGKELPIAVSECRLLPENQLMVEAVSFRSALVNGDATLAYTLESQNGNTTDPVLYFESGIVDEQIRNLIVTVTGNWNTAQAGEYSDTVTFAVSIIKP